MRISSSNGHEPCRIANEADSITRGGREMAAFLFPGLTSMPTEKDTPAQVATQIRRVLKNGGSAEHAAGVQWFFKEEIKSHGWYTAALRRAMRQCRREMLNQQDFDFLIAVAGQLFRGSVLEEKVAAVFLLEGFDQQFGNREF